MPRFYELSTYTPAPGRLDELLARFRDHTLALFERHGMSNVGYWLTDDPEPRLVYLVSHESAAAAVASWAAFGEDPEWQRVYAESMVDGRLITGHDKVALIPTDFSPLS